MSICIRVIPILITILSVGVWRGIDTTMVFLAP